MVRIGHLLTAMVAVTVVPTTRTGWGMGALASVTSNACGIGLRHLQAGDFLTVIGPFRLRGGKGPHSAKRGDDLDDEDGRAFTRAAAGKLSPGMLVHRAASTNLSLSCRIYSCTPLVSSCLAPEGDRCARSDRILESCGWIRASSP